MQWLKEIVQILLANTNLKGFSNSSQLAQHNYESVTFVKHVTLNKVE